MTSKTNIIEIDGKKYEVKEVEAKKKFTPEQSEFISNLPRFMSDLYTLCKGDFNDVLKSLNMIDQWQNYLISEARKRGFISGCTIKTSNDMDIMKSGRMQLIGLSKLATEGRKSIVIYDNRRWTAEAIPEVKKQWFKTNTWNVGKLLTREEMEKIKCEPKKYDIEQAKEIIKDLTIKINKDFNFLPITQDQAKLIREILNDYLK